jgi:hypothetical protein
MSAASRKTLIAQVADFVVDEDQRVAAVFVQSAGYWIYVKSRLCRKPSMTHGSINRNRPVGTQPAATAATVDDPSGYLKKKDAAEARGVF